VGWVRLHLAPPLRQERREQAGEAHLQEWVSAEVSAASTQLQAVRLVALCLVEEVPSLSSIGDGLQIDASMVVSI
jgi:hypothetical protein